MKYLGQCEDQFKKGRWLHTISTKDGYYQSKSGQLYRGIKQRAGSKSVAYRQATLDFKDYQEFAVFCMSQSGYYEENYHLDKDLLGDGKSYSNLTCCFIPAELNGLLQGIGSWKRGEVVGVCEFKRDKKWRAYANDNYSQIHLGYFQDKSSAFNAWKKDKALRLTPWLYSCKLNTEQTLALYCIICKLLEVV